MCRSALSRLTTADGGRVYLTDLGTAALPIDMSESVIKYVKSNILVSQNQRGNSKDVFIQKWSRLRVQ